MEVKLFGSLRGYVGGRSSVKLTFHGQISVREIIAKLNIPEQYVYVVEKDGKVIDKNTILEDENELTLLPIIAGG